MNDIQRELAEALRSGEAGQTPIPSNLLSTGNNRFSFSGLACEIYRRHHSQEGSWILSGRNRAFRFEERDHHTRMPEKSPGGSGCWTRRETFRRRPEP